MVKEYFCERWPASRDHFGPHWSKDARKWLKESGVSGPILIPHSNRGGADIIPRASTYYDSRIVLGKVFFIPIWLGNSFSAPWLKSRPIGESFLASVGLSIEVANPFQKVLTQSRWNLKGRERKKSLCHSAMPDLKKASWRNPLSRAKSGSEQNNLFNAKSVFADIEAECHLRMKVWYSP